MSTRWRRTWTAHLLWLGLCLASIGCDEGEESTAALPPGGSSSGSGKGGTSMPMGGGTSDGGPGGGGAIGDATAGLSFFECVPIVFGEDAPILSPGDFQPTHAFSGWLLDCSTPTMVVGLSEGECVRDDACAGEAFGSDEVCLPADAHRLTYYLDADAVQRTDVGFGPNVVSLDSDLRGLRVRYRRPSGLDEAGLYGNCAGSDGLFNVESIGTTNGATIGVNFNHVLTACDGLDRVGQTVSGALRVTLVGGKVEACIGS